MRKIGFFNIGRLGLVKSAGTGKTDINKVIEKWVKEHMVFWYDMSKPVDTYAENFNDWTKFTGAKYTVTNKSVNITNFDAVNNASIYIAKSKKFNGITITVDGLLDGQEIAWGYNNNPLVRMPKNGTYTLEPINSVTGNIGFRSINIVGACNITITQLPSGQSIPTNEILKANPYLQDFSGNNRPLKLNNFLFAAMSGVGGYDIASTNILPDRANVTVTDNRIIHITKKLSTTDSMVNIVPANSNPTHKFKVTGLSDGRQVSLVNRNGGFYTFDNGEHEVTLTYPEGTTSLYNAIGVTGSAGDMDVTIEFIPRYPNALVTDGVDDYGVVENLQQGVKVLFMTATPLALYKTWYAQNNFSIYGQPNTIAYNYRNADGVTYLDGTLNETIQTNNLLNKKKTVTIVNPTDGSNNNVIFFNSYGSSYMNLAFYNSIGFDSVPTKQNDGFTEQDLIDYYIPKAIVTITVVDVSGSPIQDATVTVGGVQYKTLSDGTVKVRGMANGTMSLSVKKDGYMPFSDNSWKLADSRITLEVLRNTVITENGYSILLENDGLILTE